jgi:two-component system, NarL family, sensor kinase
LPVGGQSRPAELEQRAVAEGERRIAWLRLAAIPLIAGAQSIPHPNPQEAAFDTAIGVVTAYAVATLVWVYTRRVTGRFALGATALDVAAITALAVLSGGAFSEARLTYFLIPIAVAFRFQPSLTALAGAITVAAYLAQALLHPAASRADADRFIAVQAGYLLWLGLAAVLLSAVLERRTSRVAELAEVRRRLMTEARTTEERERRALSESLHDHAIQNLLSARHDLDEAVDSAPHPALRRADAALAETIVDLREAIFELHPFVLDQAGLEAALRAVAQRAARRAGFRLHFEFDYRTPGPYESLLLAAARELLANAARHAGAEHVTIKLVEQGGSVVLGVRDDGRGFDPGTLRQRLAQGHIGLHSQRERIESVGGTLEIHSTPGEGTNVEIRVPA